MYSPSFTHQGNELTCSLHVCSKLMINMVEQFHPLPLDETYNCNHFLDTTFIRLDRLTPERCTRNGYLKILLFYYFYYLYLDRLPDRNPIMYLEDVLTILPRIQTVEISDRLFVNQRQMDDIQDMIREFNEHMHGYTLEYTTVENGPGLLPILQKVVRLGFYVGCVLVDRSSTSSHHRHSVHIVDVEGDIFHCKDTMFTKRFSMKLDEPIVLEENGQIYTYELETCLFLLPCKTKPLTIVSTKAQMDEFSEWIDTEIPLRKKSIKVGDRVHIKDVGRGIVSKVGDEFEVLYTNEKGIKKERAFPSRELTKVGGKSRRTRKRIR